MTLVQAAIANHGKCIVLASDRLWTRTIGSDFSEYGFESNKAKIMQIGRYGIGFSGNAAYADAAFSLLTEDLDLDSVVSLISSFIIQEREKIAERYTVNILGLSYTEFKALNQESVVPSERVEMVYSLISDIDISFNGLIAGYDKHDKARIVVISSNGEVMDATFTSYYSIGEGGDFSIIYHDQEKYDPKMLSESEAVYFSYRAKKWSEAPTSVGDKTDIIVIREDDTSLTLPDGAPCMLILEGLLQEEKERTRAGRKERIQRFVKESCGEIR